MKSEFVAPFPPTKNLSAGDQEFYPRADGGTAATIGDLVVELTDNVRQFVRDETQLYKIVASLLDAHLRPRR